MSATVYVIEKNERDLLIFHQKTCWYVGERVVDLSASYTADAALRKFRKTYPVGNVAQNWLVVFLRWQLVKFQLYLILKIGFKSVSNVIKGEMLWQS